MNAIQTLSAPAGRILLSLIFVTSGLNKIANFSGTQGYMESAGVPGVLLSVVIALEVLGGLAIILGWHTRIVAFLMAGFTLLTALLFHADFGDQMQYIMFMKNLAIAGGFLALVAHGAGAWSLDSRSGR